jgi:hypothetical protein
MSLFTVESGTETWDYDMPDGIPPIRHINDYWVRCGKQVVKKFTSEYKATEYAKKMNKAIRDAEDDYNGWVYE